jgi:hypothetical protein
MLLLATVACSIAPARSQAQSFQYPPYGAVRGHMVSRDGLFHVTRYRWGNGLTPQGAAFLTDAVQTIVPIIPAVVAGLVGRDVDAGGRDVRDLGTRDRTRFSAPQDYVLAQQEANDLLRRTAHLASGGKVSTPPAGVTSSSDQANATKLDEILQKLGTDPWK